MAKEKCAATGCAAFAAVCAFSAFAAPGPAAAEGAGAGFRGPERSGLYRDAGPLPVSWNEPAGSGVLWRAQLDLPGWASPVVSKGRVAVASADAARRQVVCLDAVSGKELWKTDLPETAGTTAKYELDTMSEVWNRRMHAAASPAADGTRVFALFSNGQLAALDLETGKVAWTMGLGDTSENKFGVAGSPLVWNGTVIIAFQGEPSFIAAYDAATGAEKWKTPRTDRTWSSPILAKTAAGRSLVALFAEPTLTAWDAGTGSEVWKTDILAEKPEYCVGPTPVFADGMIAVNYESIGIVGIDPDNGRRSWGLRELPNGDPFSDGVSMTTDGKNVYQYFGASVTCVEARTGKLVAQKETDESASVASPVVAGGNIYLFGSGETLVLKADPAAGFPEAGRGILKEAFDSSPAVASGRFYIRFDDSILCMGAR
jgi:outer membrane protein assembly factor BamB